MILSVRIRTGAGLSYSRIGYLDKGTHVNGGHELYYADGYEWAPVTVMDGSLAGKSGYVTTSCLEEGRY